MILQPELFINLKMRHRFYGALDSKFVLSVRVLHDSIELLSLRLVNCTDIDKKIYSACEMIVKSVVTLLIYVKTEPDPISC